MKTIGLLGGMSWESTVTYYQVINTEIKNALGGLHSAKILLHSVEFGEIEPLMQAGRWDEIAARLGAAAKNLADAGADFVLICTNTVHRVADEVQRAAGVPLLHIADATAVELAAAGIAKVGLLGTKYTMEQDFIKGRLAENGIAVLVPDEADRAMVNRVIFDELCVGDVRADAKREYLRVIDAFARDGAGGVVLGCTEIGMLVQQSDTPVPLFDTAVIHARRAARLALEP